MQIRILKTLVFILASFFVMNSSFAKTANNPVGYWQTIDDNTQQPRSIVKIWQDKNGELAGKIVRIYFRNDEKPTDVCQHCTDERKNQTILGMTILQHGKAQQDYWTGEILDPENGKVYHCTLSLQNSNTLKVRGYIGIPLFGRTQLWKRADTQVLDAIED